MRDVRFIMNRFCRKRPRFNITEKFKFGKGKNTMKRSRNNRPGRDSNPITQEHEISVEYYCITYSSLYVVDLILYFSILLHRCVTRLLITVSSATQTVHNVSYITICH
jgi:hypothetical protein